MSFRAFFLLKKSAPYQFETQQKNVDISKGGFSNLETFVEQKIEVAWFIINLGRFSILIARSKVATLNNHYD